MLPSRSSTYHSVTKRRSLSAIQRPAVIFTQWRYALFLLGIFVLGLAFLGRGQLLEWVKRISAYHHPEEYRYYFQTDKPCSPLSGGQQLTLSF